MTESEKPMAAFILSLVGGAFMLLGGGMRSMMGAYGYGSMMNGYWGYGMMGAYPGGVSPGFGMMRWYGLGGFGFTGVLFGLLVIIGSVMLYNKPADHSKWALVILIFSVLNLFGSAIGGFGIGLVLGIIGGILGLTWKSPTRAELKIREPD